MHGANPASVTKEAKINNQYLNFFFKNSPILVDFHFGSKKRFSFNFVALFKVENGNHRHITRIDCWGNQSPSKQARWSSDICSKATTILLRNRHHFQLKIKIGRFVVPFK